ncbi:MAG: ATP synthase F1 subunit delta [Acidobacteriota bacterium]|nr:ATP synthase F1 subunit delta [Acidobacteriota bacterium]
MGVETIARRYASALADVAIKSGRTEEITSELNSWQKLIDSSQELNTAFGNPSIAHASKEKVLESLIARSKPSVMTANFLRVLLRNSRLTALPFIAAKFSDELEERSGNVSGSVVSARELSEREKTAFAENLKKATGKNVRLTFEIDPELIGGAVTRVGSTVFDGSIRTQLIQLEESMIKN